MKGTETPMMVSFITRLYLYDFAFIIQEKSYGQKRIIIIIKDNYYLPILESLSPTKVTVKFTMALLKWLYVASLVRHKKTFNNV